ncbi:MAG: serine/threonine protein kinase [Phycisphaerales bacterium]|nr:serine/threonine protein kinase [Phycisphaerales bacterium]
MSKQTDDQAKGADPHDHLSWIDAACREFLAAEGQDLSKTRIQALTPTIESDSLIAAALSKALPGYKIGSECQRGGQGVVFRSTHAATQRDVAIKVLNDTSAGKARDRARFEREVKILGQLRHPNIVKIVDSGSTEGRFYYIMDYVKGLPLDDYVLKNDLPIRDALSLFVKVCDAVNVAHLRGIIHRDIKPSNIRVDHGGEPHVMDFGLAKVDEFDAIADSRTEVQTVTGQFVGTLPWSSPEQLEGVGDDLDIRTDVYSLGVVLYQILARAFPYEVGGSVRRAMENICAIDPPRPSTINPEIDDDVDCIVMKALRKNREDRYQNAGNLAREIRRYLAGEPIDAKRDNGWYVLRKTIRRHRGKAFAAALIFLLILQAFVAMILLFQQETRLRADAERARDDAALARDQAELSASEAVRQANVAEAVNGFLNDDLLAAADPEIALGREVTVRSVLDQASERIEDRFKDQPVAELRIRNTLATAYHNLGDYDLALTHYRAELELAKKVWGEGHPETLAISNNIALCLSDAGRNDEALTLATDTLGALREKYSDDHPVAISTAGNLGIILSHLGNYEASKQLFIDTLARSERINGPLHATTISTRMNLSAAYSKVGESEPAREQLEIALQDVAKVYDENHPKVLIAKNNLASTLRDSGDFEGAIRLYKEAYETSKRVLGPEHAYTLEFLNSLAGVYQLTRDHAEAIKIWIPLLETRRRVLGDVHEDTLTTMNNLANDLSDMGREEEAKALYVEALEGRRRIHGPDHPKTITTLNNLAVWYRQTGRYNEAEAPQREALAFFESKLGNDNVQTLTARSNLGELLNLTERFEEAREQNEIVAETAKRILPPNHWFTGLSLRRLGESETGLKQFESAEQLLLEAERIVRESLGEGSDRYQRCVTALVNLYDAWEKIDEASYWRAKLDASASP